MVIFKSISWIKKSFRLHDVGCVLTMIAMYRLSVFSIGYFVSEFRFVQFSSLLIASIATYLFSMFYKLHMKS